MSETKGNELSIAELNTLFRQGTLEELKSLPYIGTLKCQGCGGPYGLCLAAVYNRPEMLDYLVDELKLMPVSNTENPSIGNQQYDYHPLRLAANRGDCELIDRVKNLYPNITEQIDLYLDNIIYTASLRRKYNNVPSRIVQATEIKSS